VSTEKAQKQDNVEEVAGGNATYTQTDSVDTEQVGNEPSQAPESAEADSELQSELEAARQAAEEHQQRLLRLQADYDNFRRRSRQEKEEFAKYAAAKLLEQLLPVLDNFDRALQSSKTTSDFEGLVKGIEMVYRQFDGVMVSEGLVPIESVGQPFNPEFHQAVMQVESEEHEEGIIVEELQKGYMLKDKVIRPAMVKVSM